MGIILIVLVNQFIQIHVELYYLHLGYEVRKDLMKLFYSIEDVLVEQLGQNQFKLIKKKGSCIRIIIKKINKFDQ